VVIRPSPPAKQGASVADQGLHGLLNGLGDSETGADESAGSDICSEGSDSAGTNVLTQVLEQMCQALRAPAGSIMLRESDGALLIGFTTIGAGVSAKEIRGERLAPGLGIAGWVADSCVPTLVPSVKSDPRWYDGIDAISGFDTRSLCCVPLMAEDRVVGAIEIVSDREDAFTDDDLSLLLAISPIAALALENSRLHIVARDRVRELTRLHDELRLLLAERETTQERLIHAEKLSALGRLTGSIAHEVNNPLQAVQGCLELLEEEFAGDGRADRLERYLATARNETTRIVRIMQRLRDFYSPVRGGMVSVSVGEVIDSALVAVRDQMRQQGISVICDYSATTAIAVRANADQLRQVFLNLVSNAVEAMPTGGVLHIETFADTLTDNEPAALPSQAIRIEFRDEGQGMSPEVLANIFEPFFTTKPNGAGLGLSISYGIIQSHGGWLAAESEVGVGSVFSVWLPAIGAEG